MGWRSARRAGEGDSVVGAFARASDALAAALDAQRALTSEVWPDGISLKVRMAVNTGEAVQRDEGNYVGTAIIRTARIRNAAHGGQAFGATTRDDLARLVEIARSSNPAAPIGLSLYVATGSGRGTAYFASVFAGGCYDGLAGELEQVATAIRSFGSLGIDQITVMPPYRGTVEAITPLLFEDR